MNKVYLLCASGLPIDDYATFKNNYSFPLALYAVQGSHFGLCNPAQSREWPGFPSLSQFNVSTISYMIRKLYQSL